MQEGMQLIFIWSPLRYGFRKLSVLCCPSIESVCLVLCTPYSAVIIIQHKPLDCIFSYNSILGVLPNYVFTDMNNASPPIQTESPLLKRPSPSLLLEPGTHYSTIVNSGKSVCWGRSCSCSYFVSYRALAIEHRSCHHVFHSVCSTAVETWTRLS